MLLYDRALSDDEAKRVRAYLTAKHASLKQNLPPNAPVAGERLVPVKDAPAVQVFVPGFTVKQLPVDLTNVNNVKYRARRGGSSRLCYNGDIWVLKDTDGDGIEDKAELFYENKGKLRGPIGMDLTPPGYKHGQGVFVASKGKISLIVDTDGDGKADKEIVVADGWQEIKVAVDAVGVAVDPKDGSVYFGRGTGDYSNAYRTDKDGKAHYSIKGEEGTIRAASPQTSRRAKPSPPASASPSDFTSTRPATCSVAIRKARRGSPTATRSTNCCTFSATRCGTTASRRDTRSTCPM